MVPGVKVALNIGALRQKKYFKEAEWMENVGERGRGGGFETSLNDKFSLDFFFEKETTVRLE